MEKFYKILLLSCFFALTSFNLYSQQINLVRFNNSESYTPGSGVSVIINPTGVFDLNNQFILELSNPGGAFTTPTVLNTLNEFYVPANNVGVTSILFTSICINKNKTNYPFLYKNLN